MRHMLRVYYLLLVVLSSAPAADAQVLTGTVTDSTGAPISGVTVDIPAIDRATATAENGVYRLSQIPRGPYTISFRCVGFASVVRTVTVVADSVTLDITMQSQSLGVRDITVTATPQPTDALFVPQAVTVMADRALERKRGETVAETIAQESGVTMLTTGSGIAKPVIRGLSSQRVLVVSDGIRQEGQQWGDEHGLEIEPFEVERIEIVRGPGSVLHGSDALGGVVNVITKEPSSADEGVPQLAGQLSAGAFSGSDHGAVALGLFGAHHNFGYRAGMSARETGNTRTPSGTLFNSGGQQTNASGAIGLHSERLAVDLDYLHFDQTVEIHEDPAEDPTATPYQEIAHNRLHTHANVPLRTVRLAFNGGWQHNQRKEFAGVGLAEPELYLDLTTLTGDLKAHRQVSGTISGTAGLSVMSQTNKSKAEEKLIPEYDSRDYSGYLFAQYARGAVTLSGGVRADTRRLAIRRTEGADGFLVESQSLDYSSLSGAVGLVYRATDNVALALNLGRAWRAPTTFELFVEGAHEGTNRYEIGRDDLSPERSVTVDAAFRWSAGRIQGELSAFVNGIDDFIYLSPTGATDTVESLDIYAYAQAKATLYGGELSVQYAPRPWLILGGGADLVRGDNDATNGPLPLMPADRIKGRVRLTGESFGNRIRNPYTEFAIKGVARQNRIAPYETTSRGYTVCDWSAGFEIPTGGERVTVDLGVNNLFDTAYRDHLSRYKGYADNPGLSAYAKVSVPFTLVR